MLIRIVRMHFTEHGIEDFLKIFNTNKIAIRNFEGCSHLELLKDIENPLVYTTLSHWKDEQSLETYRKSDLFTSVWKTVKPLFSQQSQAFSLSQFIKLE